MFLDIDTKERSKTALIDNEDHEISYGELSDMVVKIGLYVEPRSIIFNLCKNTVGAMVGYLAFVNSGAVSLNLSENIDKNLLNTLIATYKPAYLWVPVDDAISYGFDKTYEIYGYTLLKTGYSLYPINDKLQFLMSTSGSTGSPKLVRYKNGNLEANAKNVAIAFGWNDRERPLCDLGMQYCMGLNVINSHLYVGATVLLTTYNIMSSEFWEYIKVHKATNFTGVPFSYDLFFRLHFDRMDLPYLTTFSEGGGKLTDLRFIQMAEYAQKTGKRFIASFGTTETSARMACLPPELALNKIGSIGRAIPEGELFLVDENGFILNESVAEGELCYRGPNVTMGYAVCKEDLLKGDEFNGVYHTGDLARRDEDGCYFVTGRLSRFLKLLSYRISLDQSERLIQQEFGIECACSGTDHQMNIYITDESKKSDVLEFITERTGLPNPLFKVFVVDEISRNENGKIKYNDMDLKYAG